MLLEKIKTDSDKALKKKDNIKVSTLRILLSEIHNKQIGKQTDRLSDEEIVKVIRQQAKQRQEAITAYKQGKRDDLVQKESKELDVLSKYLPQEMPAEEIEKIVKQIIEDLGVSGPEGFGKVMSEAMKRISGQAEGSKVAEIVKKLI